MKKVRIMFALFLGLSMASCGGSEENPAEKNYETADEIGAGVYELYEAFFKETAAKIEGGAKGCEDIAPIAEKYKSKIVELGKKREKLSDAEKMICDQAAKDKAYDLNVSQSESYKKYDAFLTKVQSDDYSCFSQLMDYMSLNLYGNLENVKQSFPDDVKLYE